jgi:hypothetical protein
MAEDTDAMAAAMAETVANPSPPHRLDCECCGTVYTNAQKARFSTLTTNGVKRRICGDCISTMWKVRAWANQPENPARKERKLWRRRS